MNHAEFLQSLLALNPAVKELPDGGTVIEHFGDLKGELAALKSTAVVCPLAGLCRIRVNGADRAKYLHNFCTNDIKQLQPGQVCEAFFTDVKAKVIAHGYVAAMENTHEVWMLNHDEQLLLTHLNRYIITEDVTIESVTDQNSGFALMGPQANSIFNAAGICSGKTLQPGTCFQTNDLAQIAFEWDGMPTSFLSAAEPRKLWDKLISAGAVPAGCTVFDHHRILEGFPIVGVDVTSDNLAPEADRISQAISYTKGCYLGQEPIARLDAMGHVNRKLFRCVVSSATETGDVEELPLVTSCSDATGDHRPALLTMSVRKAEGAEAIRARCADGRVVDVELR